MDEEEKLRALLWFAWHEFNAIRARTGAPLDYYKEPTCTYEHWDALTEMFREAIGPDAQPWPPDASITVYDEFIREKDHD